MKRWSAYVLQMKSSIFTSSLLLFSLQTQNESSKYALSSKVPCSFTHKPNSSCRVLYLSFKIILFYPPIILISLCKSISLEFYMNHDPQRTCIDYVKKGGENIYFLLASSFLGHHSTSSGPTRQLSSKALNVKSYLAKHEWHP